VVEDLQIDSGRQVIGPGPTYSSLYFTATGELEDVMQLQERLRTAAKDQKLTPGSGRAAGGPPELAITARGLKATLTVKVRAYYPEDLNALMRAARPLILVR
jgi:hypothetical protein